ncbi:MAG: TonB-dependent receptor, partial [Cytophagaceae bacterium]
LQGRVAGLAVSGNPPNQTIQIRNQGTPLFVLDGVRVDADVINTIATTDVEAVEVFKGPEAAIFGNGAAGGVIAIYTKRGNKNYKGSSTASPGLITVRIPGFYQAREFYQPRYGAPVMNAPATDPRRLTIYWNPELGTDASGQTDVFFFTADGGGNFQVTAEGLSIGGEPGRGSTQLYVTPK